MMIEGSNDVVTSQKNEIWLKYKREYTSFSNFAITVDETKKPKPAGRV